MKAKLVLIAEAVGIASAMFYSSGCCKNSDELIANAVNSDELIINEFNEVGQKLDRVVEDVSGAKFSPSLLSDKALIGDITTDEEKMAAINWAYVHTESSVKEWMKTVGSIQKELLFLISRKDVKEYYQKDESTATQMFSFYLQKKIPMVMDMIRAKHNHFRFLAEHLYIENYFKYEYPRFKDGKLAAEDKELEDLFMKRKDDVLGLLIETSPEWYKKDAEDDADDAADGEKRCLDRIGTKSDSVGE